MTNPVEATAELPCHQCGYDLRAHPADGNCPECNASVAESKRVAAIPRRPRWQDSDPRWRRRMLAGVWLLVLLPLMAALRRWNFRLPAPQVFDYLPPLRGVDETLLSSYGIFESVIFCMGMVLLFARERGRQRNSLDWTRRWGVFFSYIVFVLASSGILFICALVGVGISALFIGQPPRYQPAITQPLLHVSTALLLYGPHPMAAAFNWQIVFASLLILLGCARLFESLKSTGRPRLAMVLLAPLAFFAIAHLLQMAWYLIDPSSPVISSLSGVYFSPASWVEAGGFFSLVPGTPQVETAKWCCVLVVALWLTVAQIKSWRVNRIKPRDFITES